MAVQSRSYLAMMSVPLTDGPAVFITYQVFDRWAYPLYHRSLRQRGFGPETTTSLLSSIWRGGMKAGKPRKPLEEITKPDAIRLIPYTYAFSFRWTFPLDIPQSAQARKAHKPSEITLPDESGLNAKIVRNIYLRWIQ